MQPQMFIAKKNGPTARTKQSLAYIQQTKPEIFERQEFLAEQLSKVPKGYEACEHKHVWYSVLDSSYLEKATGRLLWLDSATGDFRDLHRGEILALPFAASGASWSGSSSSSSGAAGKPSKPPPGPKHVVIPDLHRAAGAMKMELDHLDRPCAMVGVYGVPGEASGSTVPVDVAARTMHEKLIKRLAVFRGEWFEDALFGAVVGAFSDVGAACGGTWPVAALALIVGRRLVAVAAPGARVQVFTGMCRDSAVARPVRRSSGAPDVEVCCAEVPGTDPSYLVALALAVGDVTMESADVLPAAPLPTQLFARHPRAAGASLLAGSRKRGAQGSVVAAAACLGPASRGQGMPAPVTLEGPPPKRQRPGEEGPRTVRVRQILLRYWKGEGAKPSDPVRRRPVSRTLGEAEAKMLSVLEGLMADNAAGFSGTCKALSECQSAFKGGDLIGDLGWLSNTAISKGPKSAIQAVVPPAVSKVALDLEVGELSDLVTSDQGVHLLLRSA